MFGGKHTKLFEGGVNPKDIARSNLLGHIHRHILDLEKNGLVEKGSKITGSTIHFYADKLVELGPRNKKGKLILEEKDVLEILGVDENSLKTKKPQIFPHVNYTFLEYPTNEPTLCYVIRKEKNGDIIFRNYFQITEEELRRVAKQIEEIPEFEIPKNINIDTNSVHGKLGTLIEKQNTAIEGNIIK